MDENTNGRKCRIVSLAVSAGDRCVIIKKDYGDGTLTEERVPVGEYLNNYPQAKVSKLKKAPLSKDLV